MSAVRQQELDSPDGNGPPPPPASPRPPAVDPADAGLQDLQTAVHQVAQQQIESLGRLVKQAEERQHTAGLEQQHLERMLDELSFRERFMEDLLAQAQPGATAQVQQQIAQVHAQQTQATERLARLRQTRARLDQFQTRLGWLVRQIELSVARLEEESDPARGEDPWALIMRAQLIQGQEAERSRLAREIHDGPAQVLTNTVLRLQLCEQIAAQHPAEVQAELARLQNVVREGLREVRRFIFNLRPASLSEVGLAGTIRRLVQDYRELNSFVVQANLPDEIALPKDQEMAVFRIVQEAVQNAYKHAGATEVDIAFARRGDGQWVVTIGDNGRGFDVAAAAQRVGSGLVNMRERAAIIGGTLEVSSRVGYGTKLTLTVPASEPPADAGAPRPAV